MRSLLLADQEQGLPYWLLLVKQTFLFPLCLLKYMLKSILITELNHTRHLKYLERISGPNLEGGLFWEKKIKLNGKQQKHEIYTYIYYVNQDRIKSFKKPTQHTHMYIVCIYLYMTATTMTHFVPQPNNIQIIILKVYKAPYP